MGFFFQVWDTDVIRTAIKDLYDDDRSIMIEAVKRNITVSALCIHPEIASID
jgi:hypothetical protein